MAKASYMALADRFFDSIERADFQALSTTYTADTVIWHNADDKEKILAEYVPSLAAVRGSAGSFKYTKVRHIDLEHGFVRQMRVDGTNKSGEPFHLATCLVCTVRGEKLERIDEYYDSMGVAPLL
jgi:ketosteroid isomerase-like protein